MTYYYYNSAPRARNDSYHYSESEDGGVYDGNNLLKNDYDPNGDRLFIKLSEFTVTGEST